MFFPWLPGLSFLLNPQNKSKFKKGIDTDTHSLTPAETQLHLRKALVLGGKRNEKKTPPSCETAGTKKGIIRYRIEAWEGSGINIASPGPLFYWRTEKPHRNYWLLNQSINQSLPQSLPFSLVVPTLASWEKTLKNDRYKFR